MRDTDVSWRGYFAAIPTPFSADGEVDLDSLRGVVRYYIGERAHGLVVNGSSGEWYAQQPEERERVAAVAVEEANGELPVIIGVSSIEHEVTSRLIRHAAEIGADGVMLSPPPGWRLTHEEIVDYYRRQTAAADIPMMLYNIPSDVATDMSPSLISELADIDRVVAVKESTRDDRQLYETCRLAGDRLRIFGNLMNRPGLGLIASDWGADGYIGSGMLFGRELAAAFDAAAAGRPDDARELIDRLVSLQEALNDVDGNGLFGGIPGQLKAIVNLLGQPGGYPRFPRKPVEGEELEALRRTLRNHGLVGVGD
ncbi:dihydrodipicolinate synthase family protein [Leucobacter sp. GX24907]